MYVGVILPAATKLSARIGIPHVCGGYLIACHRLGPCVFPMYVGVILILFH